MVIGSTEYGLWVLGGVVGMIFLVLVTINPQQGVYVLVATIYLNIASIMEDNYGVPEVNKLLVLLVLLGLLMNRVYLNNVPLIFQSNQGAILLYYCITILSVLFAKEGAQSDIVIGKQVQGTIDIILDLAKDFLIISLIVQLANQENVYKHIVWILIAAATLLSLLSIYQYVTGDYNNTFFELASIPEQVTVEGGKRAGGPVGDPNFYAMFLLAVLPSAIFRVLKETQTSLRVIAGICIVLIVTAVFVTFSRGALVALLGIVILFVYRYRMYPGRILAIALVLLLLLLSVAPGTVWNRISSLGELFGITSNQSASEEFSGRYSEAAIALDMFYDYPILGVGKGHYAENYLTYSSRLGIDQRREQRQAHSLYLEIAAEQGILGIAAFSVMLIVIFRSAYLAKKLLRKKGREDLVYWVAGVEYGLVAYLLASTFLHGDFERYMWLIIAIVITGYTLAQNVKDSSPLSKEEVVV
jgi:O-antigen ligase